MRSEGYPEELIKQKVGEAQERQTARLRYGALRWRLASNGDAQLKIKALDHWKLMIALRKLMRHWLIVGNNRVQWGKADMQEAFGRWRLGDAERAGALDAKPREELLVKNLKQSNELLSLANKEAESDGILKHLSL